jgi:flagellar basal body-associated protein FliL
LSRPLPRNREEIPVALVRDTVLSVLSAARAEQLVQADGKRQLKSELLQALQERLPQLGVEDVYFTEFLVQM